MNLYAFSGNICKDIDLRSTQTGKQVASFSVAINEGKDQTLFINCTAWEKTAELISQYCKKGDRLSGSGRLVNRSYDKDGRTVYVTEILVNQFDFPPKRNEVDNSATGNMPSVKDDEMASEIPF